MNKIALLAICTAVGLLPLSQTGMAEGDTPLVQGAWKVEVTLRFDAADCTTAQIVPNAAGAINPFPTFYTFHQGGTLSEYGSRAAPSYRTPGHGVWKQGNKGRISTRYALLLFDANGIQTGTLDISGDLKVKDKDQTLKGTGRYVMTDTSGNSFPFCATIQGNRITF